ncbi:MAG TPA: nucleotidyltransferase domain-containing protein [Ktedonobacterales bacterium]|nr:nucleotidyltransferase domain-containing protein [Ktedonobacterales bacterium]
MTALDLPGTEQQRRVLVAVVSHYTDDARVLAVLVFGSLGRGDWDQYSDLDLDIVLADGVELDVRYELQALCDSFAAIGERAAVIVPKRADEGDVVLASLVQLSVRYHALATTSPNIVDSMRLLHGSIDEEMIRAAGLANRQPETDELEVLCGQCLRALTEADVALQRRRLWFAVEHLARARDAVIGSFSVARGAARPLHYFQEHADEPPQASLASTLPGYSLVSAQRALLCFIESIERELGTITDGRVALTVAQRELLQRIRTRQAALACD